MELLPFLRDEEPDAGKLEMFASISLLGKFSTRTLLGMKDFFSALQGSSDWSENQINVRQSYREE